MSTDKEPKNKLEDKLKKILEIIPKYTISPKMQDSLFKSKSVRTPADCQTSSKYFILNQSKQF